MRRLSGAHRAPAHEWWPAGEPGFTTEQIALTTGVSVRVIAAGDEKGRPIVLVHGWGVHAYLWKRNVAPLVNAGFRVHAVDLPGHGLSDKPGEAGSYTLARMTDHLRAVFAALSIARAPIIAQSMGGRIAVELARTNPELVSCLVLFGSVGFGRVPRGVVLAPKFPVPRGPLSTLLVQRWMVALSKMIAYGRRARVDTADVDAYWAVTQFPDFLAAMRQALIDFDWRMLTESELARVTQATLVVFGTRDRTVRPYAADLLVRAMPHGELYWVRDAGHVANEEAADEVNPVVVQFVSRCR